MSAPCPVHYTRDCSLCAREAEKARARAALNPPPVTQSGPGIPSSEPPFIPACAPARPTDPVASAVMDNATVFAKAVQDVAEIQARIGTLELSLQQEKQLLTNAVQTQDQARTRLFDVVRPVEVKHEISAAISSQKEITNVRKSEEPKYPVVQRLAKPLEA